VKKEQRNRKVYERATEPPGPKRPKSPDASAEEVWSRVELLIESEPETPSTEKAEPAPRKRGSYRRRRRLRLRIRLLDTIAVIVWGFVLLKLFVADVDRSFIGIVAPEVSWLLDYRVVLGLLLLSMLLLLFRAKYIAGGLAYVAGYPFVVAFWKLPRFLFRKRSYFQKRGYWVAIVIANGVAIWVARGRWIVLAVAITTVSGLTILLSHSPVPIYIASVALLSTLGWALGVGAIDMLRSSRFIAAQERAIGWILDKNFLDSFLVPKRPDKLSLKDWTVEDAKAYRDTAGNALLIHRALWFWAYAIDQYRRGPALVILNVGAILAMLVQVVFVFTFINYGIFVVDPTAFQVSISPDWWSWIYYSGSAMTFGEISAITPQGPLAIVAKILNAGVGGIGVLTIVATFLISFRTARTEYVADGAVKMLKKKAKQVDQLSESEYGTGIENLDYYLSRAAWGMHVFATWMHSKLPAEWRHTE